MIGTLLYKWKHMYLRIFTLPMHVTPEHYLNVQRYLYCLAIASLSQHGWWTLCLPTCQGMLTSAPRRRALCVPCILGESALDSWLLSLLHLLLFPLTMSHWWWWKKGLHSVLSWHLFSKCLPATVFRSIWTFQIARIQQTLSYADCMSLRLHIWRNISR